MRDHLLGCAQFIPDVETEPTHFIALRKRYPLGTPSRVHRDLESHVVRSLEDNQQITAFEEFDHTPAGMMVDFPLPVRPTTPTFSVPVRSCSRSIASRPTSASSRAGSTRSSAPSAS